MMEIFLILMVLAFFCEYIDSSLGMGYGTTLTPLLLMMNFDPLMIVPAVLLSELFTGVLAGFLHHRAGNVDLKPGSRHFKVAMILAVCSVIGTVVAVSIAINIDKFILKLYIGVLVLLMGLVILYKMNKNHRFSWPKIVGLGTLAAFNKGMSGGGYGPVVTSGQILSGLDGKNAVGITSFAEGLTCVVGVITYMLLKPETDWSLAPYLAIGAILSVPLATFTVKKFDSKKFKLIVGIATTILGLFTLYNTLL